jgi:hypothetical protein
MGLRFGSVLVLVGLLSASAAAAAPLLWECDFPKNSGQGWIAPMVVVAHEVEAGSATVIDGVIEYFIGNPIAAKVSADNPSRSTFTWKVRSRDRMGQNATMEYRLTIQKADRSARMTAQALGFVGPYFASGRCKRLAG